MDAPSKMEQMKNTGKKAAEKLGDAASNAGKNLMKLIIGIAKITMNFIIRLIILIKQTKL